MIGTTVRCIYNFQSENDSDLDLKVGDLIRITNIINEDWWEGTIKEREGQFPKSFVEECNDVFNLAVAVRSFAGDQEGDLTFDKGDLIVISEIIDENWMKGYLKGGDHGVFPRAFIKEIEVDENAAVHEKVENKDEPDSIWVDVLESFTAMDSNELSLFAGTKVQVLRDVDDFWCEGKSESGAQGIFPRNFVDLPEKPNVVEIVDESNEEENKPISDTQSSIGNEGNKNAEESKTAFIIGRTVALFSFPGNEDGDLRFDIGEEIILLEKINDNWFRGKIDDRIGIFPSNYVELKEMHDLNINGEQTGEISSLESINIERSAEPLVQENLDCEIVSNDLPSDDSLDVSCDGKDKFLCDSIKDVKIKEDISKVSPVIGEAVTSTSLPNKPKKPPGKPERPKLPGIRKLDEVSPFSYKFNTKSQPLVIIPKRYCKSGSYNVILKNWKNDTSVISSGDKVFPDSDSTK